MAFGGELAAWLVFETVMRVRQRLGQEYERFAAGREGLVPGAF